MTEAPRRSGRAARHAARALPPVNDPCPPGQRGGGWRPLSDADCDRIVAVAFRLLEDFGVGEVPDCLRAGFAAAGAWFDGAGRVHFPERLILDAIDGAAREFPLFGRDPARSITVGGDQVHFGTGGAAVLTRDGATGRYRPSTLQDLYDLTRLQDGIAHIGWFTRPCVATDMPDPYALDLNTAFALLKGTTKPTATSFTLAEHVAPIVAMYDIAAGGAGGFAARPWLKAHISPLISPLRFAEDAALVMLECFRHNIPVSAITAAQSGATAPAPPAGFLAQSLAETLASLLVTHCHAPGHPMVFSNWPLVIDLRTGAFAGGGGEISLMNAASAQLSNRLGLPSGVACSMTDAKALDAQYGAEKGFSALAAGLAGGNLIYESAGMTASLLGVSPEAFLIDAEMLGHVTRILRGIEVGPETLDYDAITAAIRGDGHFLGAPQTMSSMERDYYYPPLADRDAPVTWAEKGAPDIAVRAHARVRDILAEHPGHLDAGTEADIRARFDIRLPEQGA